MENKIKIDITMTACLRPEIIKKTLQTFANYLFNDPNFEYRLILNVDVTGNTCDPWGIADIARTFFPNIVVRIGESPSFPKAFKWVWDQVDADYVFHLEDDWELLRKVSLQDMINIMQEFKLLKILRLSAFTAVGDNMKNWNRFYPWNGSFFECPRYLVGGLAFAGHPSLIESSWVYYVRKYLNDVSNPEKQIKGRNRRLGSYLMSFRYGVYGKPSSKPYIADLGRRWMIQNGWAKKGNKARFVEWEKVKND